MNEEIIKKLIQLTPQQKALLENVREAIRALNASGVELFYDFIDYEIRAVNMNAFGYPEIGEGRHEEEWHNHGFVTIPYWDAESLGDIACFMCTDDYLFGEIKPECIDHDSNLFN